MYDQIKTDIRSNVDAYWEQHERPVLLSYLGSSSNSDGTLISSTIPGGKLRPFLAEHLAESIKVFNYIDQPKHYAAVPLAHYKEEMRQRFSRSIPEKQGGSFPKSLWAAFSVPLDPGQVRVTSMSPNIFYKEINEGETTPEGFYRILPEQITPIVEGADRSERHKTISETITDWLRTNEIDLEVVKEQYAGSRPLRGESTVLSALLNTLSQVELAKINLPLDIIKKLHDRSV